MVSVGKLKGMNGNGAVSVGKLKGMKRRVCSVL